MDYSSSTDPYTTYNVALVKGRFDLRNPAASAVWTHSAVVQWCLNVGIMPAASPTVVYCHGEYHTWQVWTHQCQTIREALERAERTEAGDDDDVTTQQRRRSAVVRAHQCAIVVDLTQESAWYGLPRTRSSDVRRRTMLRTVLTSGHHWGIHVIVVVDALRLLPTSMLNLLDYVVLSKHTYPYDVALLASYCRPKAWTARTAAARCRCRSREDDSAAHWSPRRIQRLLRETYDVHVPVLVTGRRMVDYRTADYRGSSSCRRVQRGRPHPESRFILMDTTYADFVGRSSILMSDDSAFQWMIRHHGTISRDVLDSMIELRTSLQLDGQEAAAASSSVTSPEASSSDDDDKDDHDDNDDDTKDARPMAPSSSSSESDDDDDDDEPADAALVAIRRRRHWRRLASPTVAAAPSSPMDSPLPLIDETGLGRRFVSSSSSEADDRDSGCDDEVRRMAEIHASAMLSIRQWLDSDHVTTTAASAAATSNGEEKEETVVVDPGYIILTEEEDEDEEEMEGWPRRNPADRDLAESYAFTCGSSSRGCGCGGNGNDDGDDNDDAKDDEDIPIQLPADNSWWDAFNEVTADDDENDDGKHDDTDDGKHDDNDDDVYRESSTTMAVDGLDDVNDDHDTAPTPTMVPVPPPTRRSVPVMDVTAVSDESTAPDVAPPRLVVIVTEGDSDDDNDYSDDFEHADESHASDNDEDAIPTIVHRAAFDLVMAELTIQRKPTGGGNNTDDEWSCVAASSDKVAGSCDGGGGGGGVKESESSSVVVVETGIVGSGTTCSVQ